MGTVDVQIVIDAHVNVIVTPVEPAIGRESERERERVNYLSESDSESGKKKDKRERMTEKYKHRLGQIIEGVAVERAAVRERFKEEEGQTEDRHGEDNEGRVRCRSTQSVSQRSGRRPAPLLRNNTHIQASLIPYLL